MKIKHIAAAAVLGSLFLTGAAAKRPPLPQLPTLYANGQTADLTAVYGRDGLSHFSYDRRDVPPLIRVRPGGTIAIDYTNDLPVHSKELCANGKLCDDRSNLHFHGLLVSPDAPQDDVLDMIAAPGGGSLRYAVQIPTNEPPGLYWYHTHAHGNSWRQAIDGMSGPIIVEGIDRYVPRVRHMPERVLVIRDQPFNAKDSLTTALLHIGPDRCSASSEPTERIFTVNGALLPSIGMAPGAPQFWRIVNASADRYVDLAIDGSAFDVAAFDGVPLSFYGGPATRVYRHVLLAPGGRVEAIVQAPTRSGAALRTLCFDAGKDGDAHPGMLLAKVTSISAREQAALATVPRVNTPPVYHHVDISAQERSAPQFVARFTEGNHKFYINGKAFMMDDKPMVTVKVGTYVHWRVVNNTDEVHPFHIHQVHFLTYEQNGVSVHNPVWLDGVNVPAKGSIDVILDATDPVIRGVAVFHCHLLQHEDKGMMAKVLFK